ncbi:3-keto-steroid reductase [Aspergillus melleus]|uniref:3-keto-steroid reductase n=1 Tax=Aspergillus melleus TaxID=138277 RepID=UPI001E8CFC37|nr:3-keto-steroid reductase [Aspergillus melleus]KAH8428181.1 3-keto-steroid reductase [Aspergillus melleus]
MTDQTFILVTGANSGLGFSICCRAVDEFLSSTTHGSLTVIFTTRSTKKGNDTLRLLQDYLRTSANASASVRVTFIPENVDLSNLVSVRALSRRLTQSFPKLDAILLNAGIGGWTGLNWPQAVWGICTDLVHAATWPAYKLASAGVVTDPQTPRADQEPRLGNVFCANVFGHYMLAHNVMPLLRRPGHSGRIIWVSSIEATVKLFNPDDLQGLRTTTPYESSKALTDILALTSDLPSVAPWVRSFHSTDDDRTAADKKNSPESSSDAPSPTTYVSHPGICGTAIVPLALPLFYLMLAAFWLARLLGSPWHTLSTYMGACSPVWLALAPQSALDDAESTYRRHGGGRVKWGSSCGLWGPASSVPTEVDGWGYGGVVGRAVVEDDRQRRRKRGATNLTREQKEHFEELGRSCWQQMEELRIHWDGILDEAEKVES